MNKITISDAHSGDTHPAAGNNTFFLQTFGCQMNVYDGQRIANMLQLRGMVQTDDVTTADLIIINTCSIREKASNKVFSALGRIRDKKKPSAIFGIVGCVARESGADAFRRIPDLNFVLGPQSYHKLPIILDNPDVRLLNIDLGGLEKFDAMPQMIRSDTAAYIPIQEGCNHVCTYCIVPYTRGREISRPFDSIMRDVLHAANTGAIEICFLGQNVNGYRGPDDKNLSDLIRAAAKIDAIKRIRFMSSYPSEMTDELIQLFANEPKLMRLLHLPVQSGSDDVLTRMNRSYSTDLYIDIIDKLQATCPDIKISSDFIVGFPGETDAEFQQTLDLIKRVRFINSYSFKYSPRPHTAAALMKNHIPENIKQKRLRILDETLIEIMREFNTSCIGKTFQCLVEGPDKTGEYLIARTQFFQQVVVKANKSCDCIGIINIKITDANKCSLRGEIVD